MSTCIDTPAECNMMHALELTQKIIVNPTLLEQIPSGMTLVLIPYGDPELKAFNLVLGERVMQAGERMAYCNTQEEDLLLDHPTELAYNTKAQEREYIESTAGVYSLNTKSSRHAIAPEAMQEVLDRRHQIKEDISMRHEPANRIYLDRVTGSISCGRMYGEFSLNGRPLYPGPLKELWGSKLLEDFEPKLKNLKQEISLPSEKHGGRG